MWINQCRESIIWKLTAIQPATRRENLTKSVNRRPIPKSPPKVIVLYYITHIIISHRQDFCKNPSRCNWNDLNFFLFFFQVNGRTRNQASSNHPPIILFNWATKARTLIVHRFLSFVHSLVRLLDTYWQLDLIARQGASKFQRQRCIADRWSILITHIA